MPFNAFLDFIGLPEIGELEQRFAVPTTTTTEEADMSEVFEKKSISSDLAHRVIAAAEAKATEMGVPMRIAICVEAACWSVSAGWTVP